MSSEVIKDSNHLEEFISINTNNHVQQCHSCRRLESTDRMKSIEHSSQITALKNEEMKLKNLHRRLETRIKQFLNRTRNSMRTEEKLLNIEKRSENELLKRQKTVPRAKPSKESKLLRNHIQKIEEENKNLEKQINALCDQIKQMENDSRPTIPSKVEQHQKTRTVTQVEDQLHRMSLELNKTSTENAELRVDIEYMLNKRQKVMGEYHRLNLAVQNTTKESYQLTSDCSESFANRRNLVARMRAIRDQDDRDEKKLLDNIRELDRLLENNNASKNFLIKKTNTRTEQTQLNEFFAGKRSEGTKSAYTAEEFRRLFRVYFDQDFAKEKVLNRTVETFLNEQEQSFTLFEYAVELINELNHLHEDLDNKQKYIRNRLSNDNVDSFVIKDIFATLEQSVDEAKMSVQSLKLAKKNLRELLDTAYQLISDLFSVLNCDRNPLVSFHQSINDRNILLYLATIESRVQQLLPNKKINRRGRENQSYTDDTTISWRIDHQHSDQPHKSLFTSTTRHQQEVVNNLHKVDSITPRIPVMKEMHASNADQSNNDRTLPEQIVDSVLNVYNDCIRSPNANFRNETRMSLSTKPLQTKSLLFLHKFGIKNHSKPHH